MKIVLILLFAFGCALGLVLGCIGECPELEPCGGTLMEGSYEITSSSDLGIDAGGGTVRVEPDLVTIEYTRGSDFRVTFTRGE